MRGLRIPGRNNPAVVMSRLVVKKDAGASGAEVIATYADDPHTPPANKRYILMTGVDGLRRFC